MKAICIHLKNFGCLQEKYVQHETISRLNEKDQSDVSFQKNNFFYSDISDTQQKIFIKLLYTSYKPFFLYNI
mgnify:CR=1 FL=1